MEVKREQRPLLSPRDGPTQRQHALAKGSYWDVCQWQLMVPLGLLRQPRDQRPAVKQWRYNLQSKETWGEMKPVRLELLANRVAKKTPEKVPHSNGIDFSIKVFQCQVCFRSGFFAFFEIPLRPSLQPHGAGGQQKAAEEKVCPSMLQSELFANIWRLFDIPPPFPPPFWWETFLLSAFFFNVQMIRRRREWMIYFWSHWYLIMDSLGCRSLVNGGVYCSFISIGFGFCTLTKLNVR